MPKENYEEWDEDTQVGNRVVGEDLNMRRNNIMVPKPHSNFLSVQCSKCGEKTVVFSYTSMDIECKACGQLVAKKTGGKANIMGKVLSVLD